MARQIRVFRDDDGTIPLEEWFADGREHTEQSRRRCFARIKILAEFQGKPRRPFVESLGGNIHELRTKVRGINFRILFAYIGNDIVLLTNGTRKQCKKTPPEAILEARKALAKYLQDEDKHWIRGDRYVQ